MGCGMGSRIGTGALKDVRPIEASPAFTTMQADRPTPVLISGLAATFFASRRQAVPVAPADGSVVSQQPLAWPAAPWWFVSLALGRQHGMLHDSDPVQA